MLNMDNPIMIKAYDSALRLLSYRPRSETEIRLRLARKFDPCVIETVLDKLKSLRYLDDHAFTDFWLANREKHRPRSKVALRSELFKLGVDREIITEKLEDIDEESSAYLAGSKVARKLDRDCPDIFKRRIINHLRRRGFSYSISSNAALKLWGELPNTTNSNIDC